ncbi:membrane fusion protein [Pseudomonas sp. BP8]|nr:membrane fusion protein [Pseudomonas sp. BP8]
MTDNITFFRDEAIGTRQIGWQSEVVLVRPLSFTMLTLLAVVLAAIVVTFFCYGSYTRRSTVTGQLVPSSGQQKIYSPQYGVVLESFVEEGQQVVQGQRLFRVSSERTGDSGPIHAKLSEQFWMQYYSLDDELSKQKYLQVEQRKSLQSKLHSLRLELAILARQTASQERLVKLASNGAERYQGLMDKGFISMDQLQQRQAELIGQRQSLQGLIRQATTLKQQLIERQHELSGLPALHENQLANIRRSLSSVKQAIIESEAMRSLFITAPQQGVTTAILVKPGQTVDSAQALMSLVSENDSLQAELYAPSKAIGFIRVGDPVLLRYQSYPYQKFGQHEGRIHSLSKATVSATELASMTGSVPGLGINGEQIYRIRVDISNQSVMAYGELKPLQIGMLVEGDILQETRQLYEWMLEPLYSLTGKL